MEPFFTTKPPGEGTGLGLSITYNIITEHQGTITVSSPPQEGCKVEIQLPTTSQINTNQEVLLEAHKLI